MEPGRPSRKAAISARLGSVDIQRFKPDLELVSLWAISLITLLQGLASAEPCLISIEGRALVSVHHHGNPKIARRLASKLGEISGARFQVSTSPNPVSSIELTTLSQSPELAHLLDGKTHPEAFAIKTRRNGITLVGASNRALSHACNRLLFELGMRHYFPGEAWKIVPRERNLKADIDLTSEPRFSERKVFFTYGLWKEEKQLFEEWERFNLLNDNFHLQTSHSFSPAKRYLRHTLNSHPEFYALVKGERKGPHFCLSNESLIQALLGFYRQQASSPQNFDAISIEPADGKTWCECQPCQSLGSPSDRLAYLANRVGEMLTREFPDKKAAFLAYNAHGPGPKRRRLLYQPIVTATTLFLRGGSSFEGNLRAWEEAGAGQLGAYDYPSYHLWGRDLPGTHRVSPRSYVEGLARKFRELGADIFIGESSYSWAATGFHSYFLGRTLWDPSLNYESERQDFLARAFGPRVGPEVENFYSILSQDKIMLSEELLQELYTSLYRAWRLADSPSVQERLSELTAYLRYVELSRDLKTAAKASRPSIKNQLLRHLAKTRRCGIVHLKALYYADRELGPLARKMWPKSGPAWSTANWGVEDAQSALVAGRQRFTRKAHRLKSEPPNANQLVPVSFPGQTRVYPPLKGSRQRTLFLYSRAAGREFPVRVRAGLIPHYRDRGPARIRYNREHHSVPPDGKQRQIRLRAEAGLRKLTIRDGGDATTLAFPSTVAVSEEFSSRSTPKFIGRASAYFFVPRGRREFQVYSQKGGAKVFGPHGRVQATLKPFSWTRIPVGVEDGQLWRIEGFSEGIVLEGVPPYLGQDPKNFLIPNTYLRTYP